ncbi:MAG: hypothetical protein EA384_10650 [Spirochaetaceae bacterium]|nr:MAG: hypothetical protein EA384_10650 [Spirochaetaceae bacterium]
MSQSARLMLKSKYGLVHIPNRHRCGQWYAEVSKRIAAGEPAEAAGAAIAERLFRYEYKPLARYADGPSVVEIIAAASTSEV